MILGFRLLFSCIESVTDLWMEPEVVKLADYKDAPFPFILYLGFWVWHSCWELSFGVQPVSINKRKEHPAGGEANVQRGIDLSS